MTPVGLWLRAHAPSRSPRPFRGRTRLHRERGASAVEYGLLIAGIAVVIAVAVAVLGDNIQTTFDNTCTTVAGDGPCTTN